MKNLLVATTILAVALGGCANQTPAQQAATSTAIASGLLCLADASGKVVATASTSDTNALKAVNTAAAADAACQSALTNGAAAIPAAGGAAITQ
jgi:hypothetical protein